MGDISYIVLFRMLFANNLILVAARTTEREVCLPKWAKGAPDKEHESKGSRKDTSHL